jgi:hypothetical protein
MLEGNVNLGFQTVVQMHTEVVNSELGINYDNINCSNSYVTAMHMITMNDNIREQK